MKKPDIPRLSIEKFQEAGMNIPLLQVEHYHAEASFSIKNRSCHLANDYIAPNRRKFYKLMHVTAGSGILTIGLNRYHIRPYMIAFIHPDEIISWQSDAAAEDGHFCLIHPVYFEEVTHMAGLFKNYPYFQAEKAVVELDEQQSLKIA
ncbi:AraC family ligand binding domain-containing protein [Pedobacter hartonius]|uniref:AraC-like ligand binding domain-containing protein n=1 Tax=Pedobacter hartonius TaxID=425514 RepID=A0A1H4G8Z4_9SPHI|nr:AraC family ligand binding domain-containing protein [Pedobacter hartonius]SEB06044.1 AraC-like ligand binding domain-containing protein [Pedobacter hartonius]